ncbi:hypothetical protein [Thermoleophilum album]|uniref:hypothetical protein n=1 Tax=Thermoleophilum album TaxID=29539 RepID=UPI00115FA609|nr:hypothetical protein [Thermoleophilum album]
MLPLDDPAPLVVESVGDGWLPLVLLEPEVVPDPVPDPDVVAPLVDVVGTGAGHVEQVLGDSVEGVGAGAGRLLRRVPDLRRKSTRRASVARLRHTERSRERAALATRASRGGRMRTVRWRVRSARRSLRAETGLRAERPTTSSDEWMREAWIFGNRKTRLRPSTRVGLRLAKDPVFAEAGSLPTPKVTKVIAAPASSRRKPPLTR